MDWFNSFLYLCFISVIAFPIGRMIPKEWLHFDRFPFCAFSWEDGGKIYNRLEIRKWQNRVPDMSKVFPGVMKRKELKDNITESDLRILLDETCVAEVVHAVLCVLAFPCMKLWRGIGGIVFFVLYVTVFQLPYICIQRYNRPRLAHVYSKFKKEKSVSDTLRTEELPSCCAENDFFAVSHNRKS